MFLGDGGVEGGSSALLEGYGAGVGAGPGSSGPSQFSSGPSQLRSAFQTYPESSGESLEGFNMGTITSDLVYGSLLWMRCGRGIGAGQAWKWGHQ